MNQPTTNSKLSLTLALLPNRDIRGVRFYRTLFYMPAIVPVVANSILGLWILQPNFGVLNTLLALWGSGAPCGWGIRSGPSLRSFS